MMQVFLGSPISQMNNDENNLFWDLQNSILSHFLAALEAMNLAPVIADTYSDKVSTIIGSRWTGEETAFAGANAKNIN